MSLLIAIDGPSGSGKSTTAKLLAGRLGLGYLDTGAMYRAATTEYLRRYPDGASDEEVVGTGGGLRPGGADLSRCASVRHRRDGCDS